VAGKGRGIVDNADDAPAAAWAATTHSARPSAYECTIPSQPHAYKGDKVFS
jgi:hypothetical protein